MQRAFWSGRTRGVRGRGVRGDAGRARRERRPAPCERHRDPRREQRRRRRGLLRAGVGLGLAVFGPGRISSVHDNVRRQRVLRPRHLRHRHGQMRRMLRRQRALPGRRGLLQRLRLLRSRDLREDVHEGGRHLLLERVLPRLEVPAPDVRRVRSAWLRVRPAVGLLLGQLHRERVRRQHRRERRMKIGRSIDLGRSQ